MTRARRPLRPTGRAGCASWLGGSPRHSLEVALVPSLTLFDVTAFLVDEALVGDDLDPVLGNDCRVVLVPVLAIVPLSDAILD